jgi:hypothetical protein
LIYLEPKYNIRDNRNIGLRIGGAAMARDLINLQGNVIGGTANSYLGIALGFYVGGGKWRN